MSRTRSIVAVAVAVVLFAGCEWVVDELGTDTTILCPVGETVSVRPADGDMGALVSCSGELAYARQCPDGVMELSSTTIDGRDSGTTRCRPRPTTTTTSSTSTTSTTLPEERPPPLWWGDPDNDNDPGGEDDTDCMGKELSTTANALGIVANPDVTGEKVYRSHTVGSTRAEWSEAYADCDGSTELDLWGTASPPGDEVWIGWRSKFTGSFAISGSGSANDGNLIQWKGEDCSGPTVGMTLRFNRLSLRTIDGDPPGAEGIWNDSVLFDSASQPDRKDVWIDFVMRVDFKKDPTGFIELWLDGEPQTFSNGSTRWVGQTVCPNNQRVYPKWGFYDGNSAVNAYHWLDDPRIGTSYEQVAP